MSSFLKVYFLKDVVYFNVDKAKHWDLLLEEDAQCRVSLPPCGEGRNPRSVKCSIPVYCLLPVYSLTNPDLILPLIRNSHPAIVRSIGLRTFKLHPILKPLQYFWSCHQGDPVLKCGPGIFTRGLITSVLHKQGNNLTISRVLGMEGTSFCFNSSSHSLTYSSLAEFYSGIWSFSEIKCVI